MVDGQQEIDANKAEVYWNPMPEKREAGKREPSGDGHLFRALLVFPQEAVLVFDLASSVKLNLIPKVLAGGDLCLKEARGVFGVRNKCCSNAQA